MTSTEHAWVEEFPAEITVCDAQGLLIELNAAAQSVFTEDGGRALLGTHVLGCHDEPDRIGLEGMLASQQSNATSMMKTASVHFSTRRPGIVTAGMPASSKSPLRSQRKFRTSSGSEP